MADLEKLNAAKHNERKFVRYNEPYGEPFHDRGELITSMASSEEPFQSRRPGRGVARRAWWRDG